jgi:site-specific DNA recombinase
VTEFQSFFHGGITADTEEAAEKIRDLIARIVIYPTDNGLNIELLGRLTMILGPTDIYPNMRIAASGGTVVAREGLEPPTPGL